MGNSKSKKEYLMSCKRYKKFNYKEISNEDIEYLHKTDLLIFKAIIDIFRENGINYCVVGGTLLGAITTGKYIPWDEDIDMAVFEEDYEKAKKVLLEMLPDNMIVQCEKTEPKYYHEWIKVSDVNSTVYPNVAAYRYNGCWVDIYKLRKMKKRNVETMILKDHFLYLKRRLRVKDISYANYLSRIRNNYLISKYIRSVVCSLFSKEKEDVYLIGTASKPYIESKYVFPLKKYTFEGLEVYSFNDARMYLINHYGKDYDVLPDEKDRTIAISKVIH